MCDQQPLAPDLLPHRHHRDRIRRHGLTVHRAFEVDYISNHHVSARRLTRYFAEMKVRNFELLQVRDELFPVENSWWSDHGGRRRNVRFKVAPVLLLNVLPEKLCQMFARSGHFPTGILLRIPHRAAAKSEQPAG